jgi:hypothetical protein
MPNTFELIAAVTVGSGGASSIDFTSIPSTYTDLCIKLSGRSNKVGNTDSVVIAFNGLTTNRSYRRLYAYDGAAGSDTSTTYAAITDASTSTASTFGSMEIYIPNYAGSTNKSLSIDAVSENNGASTTYELDLVAGLWSNTAAINQLTFTLTGGSFVQYSTAYLYGVKNA